MRLESQQEKVTDAAPSNGAAANIAPQKKNKHIPLMIGVGVFLLIVLIFIWRIVFFYIEIQKGTAVAPRSFLSSITLDKTLESSQSTTLGSEAVKLLVESDDDPALGASKDKALLTIVEFADFGCPFSREAAYIVRSLASHTDIVRYIYRDFPITELHPGADLAAEAGECADDQNRFFDYHDKLYQNQYDLSSGSLKRYAQELGLDTREFNNCLDSRKYEAEVEADRQIGVEVGVRGTPTFFFNGAAVEGSVPRDFLLDILNRFRGVKDDLDQL